MLWADAYAAGEDRWSRIGATQQISTTIAPQLSPGSCVLDVGCGRGLDVARYAADGHAVTGIDLVALPEWEHLAARWPRVRFERSALREHRPAQPYDVVADAGCFHHQDPDDLAAYLAAIRGLLRPAGTFWLATLSPRGAENPSAPSVAVPAPDGSYTLAFHEQEITALLGGAGLMVVSTAVVRRDRPNGVDDLLVRAEAQ